MHVAATVGRSRDRHDDIFADHASWLLSTLKNSRLTQNKAARGQDPESSCPLVRPALAACGSISTTCERDVAGYVQTTRR
jgi:hypothetical protein